MGKEVITNYFCDVCDAEGQADNMFWLKVVGDGWESKILVCEPHYNQIKETK